MGLCFGADIGSRLSRNQYRQCHTLVLLLQPFYQRAAAVAFAAVVALLPESCCPENPSQVTPLKTNSTSCMCCYLFRVLLISTCQLLKFYGNLLRRISGFQCSVLTKCSSNACCIHANNRAVTIARLRCRRYFTPEFLVPSPRGIALFCSWGLQAVVICGQFCACCNYSRQHPCCHTC